MSVLQQGWLRCAASAVVRIHRVHSSDARGCSVDVAVCRRVLLSYECTHTVQCSCYVIVWIAAVCLPPPPTHSAAPGAGAPAPRAAGLAIFLFSLGIHTAGILCFLNIFSPPLHFPDHCTCILAPWVGLFLPCVVLYTHGWVSHTHALGIVLVPHTSLHPNPPTATAISPAHPPPNQSTPRHRDGGCDGDYDGCGAGRRRRCW